MKNVYYITDSTIFSSDSDLFKALVKGATIINDDADIKFRFECKNKAVYLVATDKFSDKTCQSQLTLVRANLVAGLMDRIVEARLKNPDFFDFF